MGLKNKNYKNGAQAYMKLKKFKTQDKTMGEFKRRARQMSPHKGGQSPSEYYANDILEFGGQQGK